MGSAQKSVVSRNLRGTEGSDVARATKGPEGPRLSEVRVEGLDEGAEWRLGPRGQFDRERFAGVAGEGLDLSGAAFTECELVDWSADGARLAGARFVDTRVVGLNAPSLRAGRTVWRGVELVSSRVGAFEWFETEIAGLLIEGAKLGWVNLRAAKCQDVLIRDCRIDELDLAGAELARVRLERVTVGRLTLTGARVRDLDLRGASFSAIDGIDGLRGAVIDEAQLVEFAPLLAAHLGLRVEG